MAKIEKWSKDTGTCFIYIYIQCICLLSTWVDVDSKQIYIYETSASVKGQKIIYKTPYRKLKIGQHEPHKQPEVNSCSPEG